MTNVEGRCVVVGYDGTAASTAALRWALEHADPGCAVVAVAVAGTEPPPLPGGARVARIGTRVTHDAGTLWAGWDYDVEALGDEVELVVEHGLPSEVLLRVARDRGAELLVLGRHEHLLGALAPSVLRDVLSGAPVPVVVVP